MEKYVKVTNRRSKFAGDCGEFSRLMTLEELRVFLEQETAKPWYADLGLTLQLELEYIPRLEQEKENDGEAALVRPDLP